MARQVKFPTPEEQEAAQTSLIEWAASVRSFTTRRLVEVTQLAILSSSPRLDDFAGWLLAISGGTLGLVIVNAEAILRSTDPSLFKAGIYMMIGSCVAGILERLVALPIGVAVAISRNLENAFNKVLEEFEDDRKGFEGVIDDIKWEEVARELSSPLWRPYQWLIQREGRRGWQDPGSGIRDVFRLHPLQEALAGIQVLLALCAFACLAKALL
jgi:hypothetical protein